MVDVTELNDVTKCQILSDHNILDVCNRTDCTIKSTFSEMKSMQEKEFIMEVRDR